MRLGDGRATQRVAFPACPFLGLSSQHLSPPPPKPCFATPFLQRGAGWRGLPSVLALSLRLILKRAEGPCTPRRMLCLSPGPRRGSQPGAQSSALFPGPFFGCLRLSKQKKCLGTRGEGVGNGKSSPSTHILPGSWQTKQDHTEGSPKEERCPLLSAL